MIHDQVYQQVETLEEVIIEVRTPEETAESRLQRKISNLNIGAISSLIFGTICFGGSLGLLGSPLNSALEATGLVLGSIGLITGTVLSVIKTRCQTTLSALQDVEVPTISAPEIVEINVTDKRICLVPTPSGDMAYLATPIYNPSVIESINNHFLGRSDPELEEELLASPNSQMSLLRN